MARGLNAEPEGPAPAGTCEVWCELGTCGHHRENRWLGRRCRRGAVDRRSDGAWRLPMRGTETPCGRTKRAFDIVHEGASAGTLAGVLEPDDATARTAPVELVVTGAELVATMDVGRGSSGRLGGHRRRFRRWYWTPPAASRRPDASSGPTGASLPRAWSTPTTTSTKTSPGRSRPPSRSALFEWLRVLYPHWALLDEEAVYLSAFVGLAELALGGCTTTTDHLIRAPHRRRRPAGGGDRCGAARSASASTPPGGR